MQIRQSTLADLSRIMEIYALARSFMAEHGNPKQWGATNWPPQALIEQDIAQGKSYVCTEGDQVIGTFFYDHGIAIEETYREIDGAWMGSDEYGVVHRIATDGSQKGIGSFCMRWALEHSPHLRIDTHPDNLVMQGMLTKLGFVRCGIIHVQEDDDPRYAYEKC